MHIDKTFRIAGLAAVAAAMPALIAIAAHAQAPIKVQAQAPASEAAPAAKAEPAQASPSDAAKSVPPAASKDAAAAPSTPTPSTTKDVAVGAAVIGADGASLGEVKGVKADPSGTVEEIHVKTGGVLGFGAKVVVIPASKIAKGGKTVQLSLTAADIGKLPPMAATKG